MRVAFMRTFITDSHLRPFFGISVHRVQNDVMCPIDSHWPIEKYKAVDEAFQNKDKDALSSARNELE